VNRRYHMGIEGNMDPSVGIDAVFLEHVDLFNQPHRINHHPVSQKAVTFRAQDTGGDLM